MFEESIDHWGILPGDDQAAIRTDLTVLRFFTRSASALMNLATYAPRAEGVNSREYGRAVETIELSWSGSQQHMIATHREEPSCVTLHEALVVWSHSLCRSLGWLDDPDKLFRDCDACREDSERRNLYAAAMLYHLEIIDFTTFREAEVRVVLEWSSAMQMVGMHEPFPATLKAIEAEKKGTSVSDTDVMYLIAVREIRSNADGLATGSSIAAKAG